MDMLRVFIKWLESIDGVEQDLHTKVRSPTLSGTDNVRDVMLDPEQAEQVLDHLRKYEYASRPHMALALMWHTMMRVGAVHALDCEDYDSSDQSLQLVHRPETGTPLENGEDGERFVAVSGEVSTLLDDWLADRRPAVTDDTGREPLVTTPQGRAHRTTLRGDCYRFTRPCVPTEECPHDRAIEECSATEYDAASECPSSVSPHALRRGGITYALSEEWPMKAIGDRANVSKQCWSSTTTSGRPRRRYNSAASILTISEIEFCYALYHRSDFFRDPGKRAVGYSIVREHKDYEARQIGVGGEVILDSVKRFIKLL